MFVVPLTLISMSLSQPPLMTVLPSCRNSIRALRIVSTNTRPMLHRLYETRPSIHKSCSDTNITAKNSSPKSSQKVSDRTREINIEAQPVVLKVCKSELSEVNQNRGTLESNIHSTESTKRRYRLQFDGGSRGNPGISGYGFIIRDHDSGHKVWEAYGYLDDATNNEAEYSGLIEGLKYAQHLGVNYISVEGDSQLVVRQMTGVYAVKASNLKPLFHEALALSNTFHEFSIKHIAREENKSADMLANQAMDRRQSFGLLAQIN